jgi:hypothetical protein
VRVAREREKKKKKSNAHYRDCTSRGTRNEKRPKITPKLTFKNLSNRTTILPVQKRIL